MEQSKIDRISQLTRIARQRELTEEEQQERQALRREYIDSVKQSLDTVISVLSCSIILKTFAMRGI